MKKCEKCGREVIEPQTTIKIKELNIEVEKDIHEKGKSFDRLICPNGWRLLKVEEIVFLANSKYAEELKMFSGEDDFFFEQPFEKNKEEKLVAGFGANSDGAYLDCYRDPVNSYSSLGVRYCKEISK